jgi:hypothetical protein
MGGGGFPRLLLLIKNVLSHSAKKGGCSDRLTVTIPELRRRGHAEFIGHDIAFKIRRDQ